MQRLQTTVLPTALRILLLALIHVIQASVFGRFPPFGIVPTLFPCGLVCVTLFCSPDAGAILGLLAGLIAYLGGSAPAVCIPLMTLTGALTAALCSRHLTRSLLSALLLSLLALPLCELPTWLFYLYRGLVPVSSFFTVLLPAMGCAMVFTPVWYLFSRLISLLPRR